MVVCNMDPVIPRPPEPPLGGFLHSKASQSVRSKRSSQGFRLVESNNDDTGSVYSIYKQKIDSMFESDSIYQTKNSVQARIERMFTDVAIDNGIPLTEIGCHSFSVDYLGSVPLQEKVTSLAGLQQPLKELYFAYKKNTKHKQPLSGRLEISAGGLKVLYQGEKGDLEQLNSFPTIAVWSAVKFVLHEDSRLSYAFLPLITDPDNVDKQQLFRLLDANEQKYITTEMHSPLFAVVMRKIGVQKQLECHGFVCQTSEDAIVIAATLYKSLMSHMKTKEKRPKNRNGVTCMSVASSAFNENSSNAAAPVRPPRKKRSSTSSMTSDRDFEVSDSKPLLSDSSKSPKKSTKSKRAPKAPEPKIDLDAIVPYEEPIQLKKQNSSDHDVDDFDMEETKEIKPRPLSEKWNTYMSNQQKQIAAEIKQVMTESSNMGLKRVKSLRRRNEEGIANKSENSGDILTKVTIPRSGSFLNAGGLTRYKSKMHRLNGQASGGSPLGFNELFNEFRLQEGLHSMDEILGVIIDSEGMSFNDLKPIYKEFLLKLAVTLTKDELYQRSKSIMRRQKKKLLRRNSSVRTKHNHVICTKFKRLKHAFQKMRLNKKCPKKSGVKKPEVAEKVDVKLPESSLSSSSYDTRQFRPKEPTHVSKKHSYRKRANEIKGARRDRTSTSEESDFFSLRRSKTRAQNFDSKNHNKNSSSGYVSCSECSYDSDTCTCVSADKCYCSLGNKHFVKVSKSNKSTLHSCKTDEKCYCSLGTKCYCSLSLEKGTLTWCGCDTDSCTESNKCYCQNQNKSTIFEQLKQRGFIPSSESATTPPNHRKLCKKNSNTKSTRSLEYMPNPTEQYYEKLKKKRSGDRRTPCNSELALDYELFTVTDGQQPVRNRNAPPFANNKTSVRSYSSTKYSGKTLQSAAIPTRECNEALSVKKSAEIAALFADIKLSQTTDITQMIPKNRANLIVRNAYSQIAPTKTCTRPENTSLKSEKRFNVPCTNRMIANSLFNAKNIPKNNMYSARNGLYTIQSQSDESRRSTMSESRKRRDSNDSMRATDKKRETNETREYYTLEPEFDGHKNDASSILENSLGYLP